MFDINGLTKRYGNVVAADGVSFRADEGEAIGLLGPNGAGKTTTVSMIAGLLRPDAGEVLIAGVRPEQAGDHRYGGGLAGTVWSEQSDRFALVSPERHPVGRDNVAVPFSEPVDIEHRQYIGRTCGAGSSGRGVGRCRIQSAPMRCVARAAASLVGVVLVLSLIHISE